MLMLKIAVRNLRRQWRRNIWLLAGVSLGMCILFLVSSFAHGITDILLNKIIKNLAGHIQLNGFVRENNHLIYVIKDKAGIISIINRELDGIGEIRESVTTGMTRVKGKEKAGNIVVVGLLADPASFEGKKVVAGNIADFLEPEVRYPIVLYRDMADSLNVGINDTVKIRFDTISKQKQTADFRVTTILEQGNMFEEQSGYARLDDLKHLLGIQENETVTLQIFMARLTNPLSVIAKADKLHDALAQEWTVLERSKTSAELLEKYKSLNSRQWDGMLLDVSTMYESANQILEIEMALKAVSFQGVSVLFFILLIGVINSLRMSIRERTREIGTVRAIGMSRLDLKLLFVLEILILTLVGCLIGCLLGLVFTLVLSRIPINILPENPMQLFLYNDHLHFSVDFLTLFLNILIICIIAFVIAFLVANKASKLKIIDALHHYE